MAMGADREWIPVQHQIFQTHIQPALPHKTEAEIKALFAAYDIEDMGWKWQQKAISCSSSDYLWFCLEIEGITQGAAVILHPEKSYIYPHNIFYVDYLASAPWNRHSQAIPKKYSNIGTTLLTACANYCIDALKYTPGFNLHSLPKAESYYTQIGMTDLGTDSTKQYLRKFEMIAANCQTFLKKGTNP